LARYCVDANIAIAYLFEQDYQGVTDFWNQLEANDDLASAQLWRAECTSVIREACFDDRISFPHSVELVEKLLALPVTLSGDPLQFSRAINLAARFQHKKAYDMQYLAVAELTASTLVTRDRGLRHAAAQVGVSVRFLA
jgi:predicted nucleic acid-binding protein